MSILFGKTVKVDGVWSVEPTTNYKLKGKYAPQLLRLASSVGLELWIYKMSPSAMHFLLESAGVYVPKGHYVRGLAFRLEPAGYKTLYALPPTSVISAYTAVHECFHVKLGHLGLNGDTSREYETEANALRFCEAEGIPVTSQVLRQVKINLTAHIQKEKREGRTPYAKAVELRDSIH